MAFVQAYIQGLDGKSAGTKIYFQFNPETISFSKSVKWTKTEKPTSNNPDMDFGGGKSGTFSISDVVFDATLPKEAYGAGKQGPAVSGQIVPVIESLIKLAQIDDSITPEPRPPKCKFFWGPSGGSSYAVYVESVTVTYELFASDGTPLRAKVSLKFVEAEDADALPYQNPTSRSYDRKMHTVVEGETLDWIAYREYGSASAWRHIAENNGIDNPLDLHRGQVLRLPPRHQ